jgi:phage-related protein
MRTEGFFEWLGRIIGTVIRFIVDLLSGVLGGIGQAIDDFFNGLARAIGMDVSFFSLILLVIGLLLLYGGVRAFVRKSIIGGLVLTLLGLTVMSWLVV